MHLVGYVGASGIASLFVWEKKYFSEIIRLAMAS